MPPLELSIASSICVGTWEDAKLLCLYFNIFVISRHPGVQSLLTKGSFRFKSAENKFVLMIDQKAVVFLILKALSRSW